MATQSYVDTVTLSAAAEFNKFDTAAYVSLTSPAGTNTITATGPANLTSAAGPPLWFLPAATNTGATTINITPSGGSALGAKNVFARGAALVGGEIIINIPACILYDGTRYHLLNPNSDLVPINSQSAAYTTILTDRGKAILHPTADVTARTFTIDSNANVAYPIGTAIVFVNQITAGVLTIAITTDTMYLSGGTSTGSRTLTAVGVATALKVTATQWVISGTNLT